MKFTFALMFQVEFKCEIDARLMAKIHFFGFRIG
jgi:hypothetical protein